MWQAALATIVAAVGLSAVPPALAASGSGEVSGTEDRYVAAAAAPGCTTSGFKNYWDNMRFSGAYNGTTWTPSGGTGTLTGTYAGPVSVKWYAPNVYDSPAGSLTGTSGACTVGGTWPLAATANDSTVGTLVQPTSGPTCTFDSGTWKRNGAFGEVETVVINEVCGGSSVTFTLVDSAHGACQPTNNGPKACDSNYVITVSGGSGSPPGVDPNGAPDATCTGADTDKTTGAETAPASEGCMDQGAMTYNSSDYELRRAQGGVGGATSSATTADGTSTAAAASGPIAGGKCTDDPPLAPNFGSNNRQVRRACMQLRELEDTDPTYKYYSQELYAYAAAGVNYKLSRVKVRSVNRSPGVYNVQVDPGADYDVADGGTQSTNWSFGLGVKGLSGGASTTTTKPTHSGSIHPYPFSNQLYHVSWMSKNSGQRLPAGVAQEAIGSVEWKLPEAQPLVTDLAVQVWTCPSLQKYVDQRCTVT